MFRMMIVEDEPWSRKALEKMLPWHELNIEHVGSAKNGSDFFDLVEGCQPDIILTDIKMPIIDGLSMLDKLSEDKNLMPKVIIISGYGEFDYTKRAIKHGVIDYILKPVDPEELKKSIIKVTSLLAKERKEVENLKLLEIKNLLLERYDENELLQPIKQDAVLLYKEENEFLKALQNGDRTKADQLIDRITSNYNRFEQKWMIHFQLYLVLCKYLTVKQIESARHSQSLHQLKSIHTSEELIHFREHVLRVLVEDTIQNLKPAPVNYVLKVKHYIDSHYDDPALSLEQVSHYLHLSPSYLSYLFKKETGTNFTSHVTKRRIEAARNILLVTKNSIHQISEKVGFNDVKYFIKVFKKETGFTPNRYREMNL